MMQILGPHRCLLLQSCPNSQESCPNSQDHNFLPNRNKRQYSQHYNHPPNLPPNHPFYGMMQLHGFHHCVLLLPILPQQSGSSSIHRIGLSGAYYSLISSGLFPFFFPFFIGHGGEGPTGLQTPWALCRHKGEASLDSNSPFFAISQHISA